MGQDWYIFYLSMGMVDFFLCENYERYINPTSFMDFYGVICAFLGGEWRGCAIRATRWMGQVACGGCSCQVGKK